MVWLLEIATVLTAAVAMALSLAHALELPGKMRLAEEHYLAVQPIYYPGFTWGGIAEPLSVLLVATLLVWAEGAAFWLTAAALLLMISAHGAYWLLTHPVNGFWLKDTKIGAAGTIFFGSGTTLDEADTSDWRALRDRWERSHVVRAVLSFAGLALLTAAIAI